VRFAADGAELASVHFTVGIRGIAVDPRDGSCWIGAGGEVLRVGADGSVLSRTGGDLFPTHLWVDPSDGSCWASDGVACGARPLLSVGKLVHLAPDGTRLGEIGGFDSAGPILSGGDGAAPVFAADTWNGQVVCLRRGFHDVPKSHWAFEAIMACVDAGIVAGYPDGRYRPDRPVTRDQMAVYIARAIAGGDMSVPAAAGDANFPDVLEDFWAYRHIQYAAASNVVAGYEDGLYHPEYEVTRDQMAVYVARALVAPTGEAALADYVPADPHNFPDVPDTFWAYKHIEYCVENDVVMGYEDGLYHPYVVVTRDQMAVYIARAFDLLT
jgi:hypothetical protein